MRILVIEPDSATAQTIELMLKSEGHSVYTTDLGEEGVDLAKVYDYDLITCEVRLPDMGGVDVVREVRAAGVQTPLLILAGEAGIDMKVRTLGAGADDYMTKPFHKDEMCARIHALIRRSCGHAKPSIDAGPISVDVASKTVKVNGEQLSLTGKEYQMMELLALRKNACITKEAFLNHLYGGLDEPEIKIIDVFICKLRSKLRTAGAVDYIETVWGRGYVLRDEQFVRVGYIPKPEEPPLETTRGKILIALAKGMRRNLPIAETTGLALPTVWAALRKIGEAGLAVDGGGPRSAWWEPTERGLAWLAENGWVAPAKAA